MARSGDKARVAVIGGGIAGLAAAYYLGQAGIAVDLYEAEEQTGGLARSFDLNGLMVERYYHFICRPDHELLALAGELGLSGLVTWRSTRTTFFHQGRLYPFTTARDLLGFSRLALVDRIRLGLEFLRWWSMRDWLALDKIPAREWLIERLGEQVYEAVWAPLLTMKFGQYSDKISAAWLWHRINRVARSRRTPLHPQVMGYFRGGTEVLLTALRERILAAGGSIYCQAQVEAVLEKEGRAAGIRVSGEEKEYDGVILAVPLPQAAGLLPDSLAEYRAGLERINFIGVVCLAVHLERSITGSFWCNIHDRRIHYNGIIEMSQLNPETGRSGTLAYVPYYLPVDNPRFTYSDEKLLAEFIKSLELIRPEITPDHILSYRVFRSRFAQAICTTGFMEQKPAAETPLKGLYLIDSTQLYPSDRTLSGTIGLSAAVSALVRDYLREHLKGQG